LDLENKYLKRLYELQFYKRHVREARDETKQDVDALKQSVASLEDQLSKEKEAFLKEQKEIAV